jgi:hypothetical protein
MMSLLCAEKVGGNSLHSFCEVTAGPVPLGFWEGTNADLNLSVAGILYEAQNLPLSALADLDCLSEKDGAAVAVEHEGFELDARSGPAVDLADISVDE